jgi:N-acetylglucosamine kinase-like BadF-type ATPase
LAFYLALDVGGTKTEYVLADETHELARVRGGTIKRMRTDADTASQNLDKALAELTELTGVSMNSITRLVSAPPATLCRWSPTGYEKPSPNVSAVRSSSSVT